MRNGSKLGSRSARANYILITIALFAAFAIFGFSEIVKGPAIPRMQDEFHITELQLGLLLAVNSIGYLIACSFTATVARKIGVKTCMIIALIVMALSGVCICLSNSYPALLLAYFVLYLGNGMLEIALGIISATTFTKNTGTMMNLAHFFYGAGSVFSPVVATWLMSARFGGGALGWRYMYLIVMSWAIIPIIPAVLGRLETREYHKKKSGYKTLLKNPTLWLVVLIITLGSTCEMGVGSWLVNFLEKAYSFSSEKSAFMLTAFFICFTLARLVLGPAIDKIGFINSLAIVTAFAGIMIIIGVLCGESGVVLLVVAGVGVSPIYPTMMAVIARLFSEEIDLAVTCIMTIMGILIVVSNFILGGIVYLSRLFFTGIYGEAGVPMAYAAGYIFLGLCCLGACAATIALKIRQKKLGQIV